MASDSDDELGDYTEAPVRRPVAPPRPGASGRSRGTTPSAASITTRAGPSKSRPKGAASSVIQEQKEDDSEEEVEEDMDVEEGARVNGRSGMRAARKTVTAASAPSRGKGRTRTAVVEEEQSEDEALRRRGRPAKAVPPVAGSGAKRDGKLELELRRRLEEVTRQRDIYAEQFDELVRLKGTEQEILFADYKRAAEERAKDQAKLIAKLESQMIHLQDLNRKGQALPMPLMVDHHAERRREQEREDLEAREREWKRREEDLKRQLADSQAAIVRLKEDRPIAPTVNGAQPRSGIPPSTPGGKHGVGPTKNSIVVCLYEDLTNLLVTKCTIENGQFGEEHNFVCVLTSHGKSLQFSLRTFRVLREPPEPKDPYMEKVIYNPLELDKETDNEWVERLDFLKEQFTFDRTQMNVFLATAHNKMDYSPEDEDDAKMEDEE